MRPNTVSAVLGLILLSGLAISADQNAVSSVPKGWLFRCVAPQDYRVGVDHQTVHGGRGAAFVEYAVDPMVIHPKRGSAFLCTRFKADKYCGHRIRVTAYAKGEKLTEGSFLWISLDGIRAQPRRVALNPAPMKRSMDWTKHECVLDVPSSIDVITLGVALAGRGTIWLDDISVTVVGPEVPVAGVDGKGPGSLEELNLGEPPSEPTNLSFEQ
ncbi:MAG: hypothetical protein IT282_07730 [Bacteroidetes bacterium]|nr:hypothetical protein [Bacteroidota bacterium]